MTAAKRFEELQAWQKARKLVRSIYEMVQASSISRDFGLRDQLQRAAVSIMSNIAEGFGRCNDKEFARYLDFSRASGAEVQSLLYVSLDAGYMNQATFDGLYGMTHEVLSVISGLSAYLKGRSTPGDV